MKLKYFLSALTLSILSTNAMALVDRDSDGLIEINNLDDLNEMRNDVFGKTLRDDSSGCPADTGCFGYELTRNLDIGSVNWVPIGDRHTRFSAIFDGNFHTLNNLTIDSNYSGFFGFFGFTQNAEIKNVGLLSPEINTIGATVVAPLIAQAMSSTISNCYVKDASVTTVDTNSLGGVGGLVGELNASLLKNSYFDGKIKSDKTAGGLVGNASTSMIEKSYSNGSIEGEYVAGLVRIAVNTGIADSFSNADTKGEEVSSGLIYLWQVTGQEALDPSYATISNSYSVGTLISNRAAGGLVSRTSVSNGQTLLIKNSYAKNVTNLVYEGSTDSISVEKSYWVKDPEGTVLEDSGVAEGSGQLLADMQCASNPVNKNCAQPNLFKNWDKELWDFGDSSQLPALRLKTIHPWMSSDTPDDGTSGDYETISNLKKKNANYTCNKPSYFYAKPINSGYVFNAKTPEVFSYFSAQRGLACVNTDQSDGLCNNYEVAYLCEGSDNWTAWKSRDKANDGSSGDYEPYDNQCGSSTPVGIRIRKVGATNIYYGPSQKLHTFNLTEGLKCVNADNMTHDNNGCKNYEVRMTCDLLGDRE